MADIGRTIGGRYRLVEELGEDEISTVFRAHDSESKVDVAFRVLRPELAADHDFVAELRLQTRAAARLDHPSIVAAYDFGGDAKGVYLVDELVEGQDLGGLLRRNGPVPARRAASVTAVVADAVAAAHEQGLVHGGLRASKVIVTRDAEIKFGDFGLARALSECATPPELDAEQAAYQSPEQLRGRRATDSSDIYSLGVLLFDLLTGSLPWEGETAQEVAQARLADPDPKPSDLRGGIPAEVEAICRKAMAQDVTRRYQSAAAMAEALQATIEVLDARYAAQAAAPEPAEALDDEAGTDEPPTAARIAPGLAPIVAPPLPVAPIMRRSNPMAQAAYSPDDYAGAPAETRPAAPPRPMAPVRQAAPVVASPQPGATAYASDYSIEAARRGPRRINPIESEPEPLPDDDDEPVSVWAWVAGFLALFLVTLILLTIFLLLNRSAPAGTVVYAPNLVDLPFASAQLTAQQSQLQIVATYQANNTDKADNTVVDQNPDAGTPMHHGDTIYVTVVGGAPLVKVPNVVGLTETDAKNALTTANLQIGNRTDAYDPTVPEGSVVSSNPKADTTVARGSSVDYVVSKGPQPTPTPAPTASPSPSSGPTPTPTPTPTAAPTAT